MAENKMKEVAKLLGVELGVPFKIKGKGIGITPHTLSEGGLYDKRGLACSGVLKELLTGTLEIEQPILDKTEKRYLEGVLRPFKDMVEYVEKSKNFTQQYIIISIMNDTSIILPSFEVNAMYKGMELYKRYTLEELGLFQE